MKCFHLLEQFVITIHDLGDRSHQINNNDKGKIMEKYTFLKLNPFSK